MFETILLRIEKETTAIAKPSAYVKLAIIG